MKWKALAILAISTCTLAAAMADASEGRAADWKPGLDAELTAIVRDVVHPLASLSVLAVRDGKIVYQKQVGHRFIDNTDARNSKPANADTLYRIASISKLEIQLW